MTDRPETREPEASAEADRDRSAEPSRDAAALARPPQAMPFGPYAGLTLTDVARLDPGHLLALVREGIGSAELRATAAQALARGAADYGGPAPAPGRPEIRGLRRLIPWLLGAGLGVAALRFEDGRTAALGPVPAVFAPATAAAPLILPTVPSPTAVTDDPSEPAPQAISAGPVDRVGAVDTAASPSAPPAGAYDPQAPCGARAAGAIAARDAATYLNQFAAVEFAVVGAKDTGKVTFLNSHEPYKGHFYVAIFPDLYEAFPPAPASLLTGHCVVVQGRIEAFRGVPQIVLHDAADLRDLGAAEPVAAGGTTRVAPPPAAVP